MSQATAGPIAGRPAPRIVLSTFGSLGDLHPTLALAVGLKARGFDAAVATSATYRERVEALGLGFRPVRPDHSEAAEIPEFMRRMMDLRTGPEQLIRHYFMPRVRDSFDDMMAASSGADLLVSHPITFATRLAAEVRGIPWASCVLAPTGFFSIHDPPALAPAPFLSRFRPLGPRFYGPLFRWMRRSIRPWSDPWHRLRGELGLAPAGDPLFEGQHAPGLVLAMFSRLLGGEQPDWPPQARITGFAFHDEADSGLDPTLGAFLDDGPPPIVFTLGSAAVAVPGRFYEEAARLLGRRAVLLVGQEAADRSIGTLPSDVILVPYAPFALLFPRAAAIVHQGGVGTTGQAMRSGRPMVVVPHAHDQPDNAERVERLGIARVVPRHRFRAARAAAELDRLLGAPSYSVRAAEVGTTIRAEDGTAAACDALAALVAAPIGR